MHDNKQTKIQRKFASKIIAILLRVSICITSKCDLLYSDSSCCQVFIAINFVLL